jgi:site-specific recombinase XerD
MRFHSNEKYLQRILRKIEEKYPDSYKIIEDFSEDLLAEGITAHRIYSYVLWLRKSLDVASKRIDTWDKRDTRKIINRYQIECNEGNISENSLREVKKTLKKFFKWLEKDELADWFSLGDVVPKVSPQDLITQEEFERMLEVCMNSRDRALLSLL